MANGQGLDVEIALPKGTGETSARTAWMFWIAFLFLALVSVLLPHGGTEKPLERMALYHHAVPVGLAILWAVIIAEAIRGCLAAPDRRNAVKRMVLCILLPPCRMVFSPRRPNDRVWLPIYGWRPVSTASVTELEQRTALPMLLATALIVPVLIADFGFADAVAASRPLRLSLAVLMAFIWFSFALEFVVMVSLAPNKLAYCKKHWINIVIILLPLVAFLRSLQMFRFLRVAKAGKLARAYRLRGLATRTLKIALAFNLIERIMSMSPDRYAASLEAKIAEKEAELVDLRGRLEKTRQQIAERDAPESGAHERG